MEAIIMICQICLLGDFFTYMMDNFYKYYPDL